MIDWLTVKFPKKNTLAYGLIEEETSSVLDEIVSKTVHKHEEGDQWRKKK